jgi:hypothetical protein
MLQAQSRKGVALAMEHEHSEQAIAQRLSGAPSSSYLRDWVYGGIDGAVTTRLSPAWWALSCRIAWP